MLFIFSAYIILLSCNSQNQKLKKAPLIIIDSVSFVVKPNLVYKYVNIANDNGVSLKVYDFSQNKEQTIIFDSLLKKGFKRLPINRFSELPLKIKPYLKNTDSGYYYYHENEIYGQKFIVVNLTDSTFIVYEDGMISQQPY
mgnify:CR=1 FL=1